MTPTHHEDEAAARYAAVEAERAKLPPIRAYHAESGTWAFACYGYTDIHSAVPDYFRVDPPAGRCASGYVACEVRILEREGNRETFLPQRYLDLSGVLS